MGFFSFLTADTNESIANVHSGHPNSKRPVYMLQPKGKEPIECTHYDGHGVFAGVDAYAWLAKMNIENTADLDLYDDCDELREWGIALAFHTPKRIKYPLKFSYSKNAVYEQLPKSEKCPYQGFFFDGIEL